MESVNMKNLPLIFKEELGAHVWSMPRNSSSCNTRVFIKQVKAKYEKCDSVIPGIFTEKPEKNKEPIKVFAQLGLKP